MPQFAATIKHLKDGVKSFTVNAAVKNIEGWEATLEKSEVSGAKTIHGNLERLRKALQADEIDGAKVKDLMVKLGEETVRIAGKADDKHADKIKALGEAIGHAAETAGDDGKKDDKKAK